MKNIRNLSLHTPQGPRDCMNTAIAREREMKWMQSIGVKGIKVDFFGGDKQDIQDSTGIRGAFHSQ